MTLTRSDEEWRALATTLKHRLGNLRKAYRELQRTYQLRSEAANAATGRYMVARKQSTDYWEKWRLANDEIAQRDADIRRLKDDLLAARTPTWQRMVAIIGLVVVSIILGVLMGVTYR